MGGGGNDAVKSTNINEIHILSAGYQKPAKTVKKSSADFVGREWEVCCPESVAYQLTYPLRLNYFFDKARGFSYYFCVIQQSSAAFMEQEW